LRPYSRANLIGESNIFVAGALRDKLGTDAIESMELVGYNGFETVTNRLQAGIGQFDYIDGDSNMIGETHIDVSDPA
jgi:hypothetical protein